MVVPYQSLPFSCKYATSCLGRQPLVEKTQSKTCLRLGFSSFSIQHEGKVLLCTKLQQPIYCITTQSRTTHSPIIMNYQPCPSLQPSIMVTLLSLCEMDVNPSPSLLSPDFITSLHYPLWPNSCEPPKVPMTNLKRFCCPSKI